MPNQIDASGLTIQTQPEIVAEILDGVPGFPGMRTIYGADINVEPNSPDGQMVAIVAQAKIDVLEFLQQIYNSFDPDKAVGVALNARVAINGIMRRAGTFTIQPMVIHTDRALTLQGLDTFPDSPFTVSDGNGNEYVLTSTFNAPGPGDNFLSFQAKLLGAISSLPNTITTAVTVILGVNGVNNPAGPDSIGQPEETDFALRIRRQQSVSLPNKGYLDGLLAALVDTDGVIQAVVYENNTDTTDANGIPSHSIWVIVNGGTDQDIAEDIYVKRNAGCGMKGSVVVNVLQVDGTTMPIRFDRPTGEALYLSFTLASIGGGTIDPAYVRAQILAGITFGIGQIADVTTIVAFIRALIPNAVVSDEGVSDDNVTYLAQLAPAQPDYMFQLIASRIIINGVAG